MALNDYGNKKLATLKEIAAQNAAELATELAAIEKEEAEKNKKKENDNNAA